MLISHVQFHFIVSHSVHRLSCTGESRWFCESGSPLVSEENPSGQGVPTPVGNFQLCGHTEICTSSFTCLSEEYCVDTGAEIWGRDCTGTTRKLLEVATQSSAKRKLLKAKQQQVPGWRSNLYSQNRAGHPLRNLRARPKNNCLSSVTVYQPITMCKARLHEYDRNQGNNTKRNKKENLLHGNLLGIYPFLW